MAVLTWRLTGVGHATNRMLTGAVVCPAAATIIESSKWCVAGAVLHIAAPPTPVGYRTHHPRTARDSEPRRGNAPRSPREALRRPRWRETSTQQVVPAAAGVGVAREVADTFPSGAKARKHPAIRARTHRVGLGGPGTTHNDRTGDPHTRWQTPEASGGDGTGRGGICGRVVIGSQPHHRRPGGVQLQAAHKAATTTRTLVGGRDNARLARREECRGWCRERTPPEDHERTAPPASRGHSRNRSDRERGPPGVLCQSPRGTSRPTRDPLRRQGCTQARREQDRPRHQRRESPAGCSPGSNRRHIATRSATSGRAI